MKRRITYLSNLMEAIETGMISVIHVESNTKLHTDIADPVQITPESFIESVQFLAETVFKNAIDICYELTSSNSIRISCGMKNAYMNEYFHVNCVIKEGLTAKEVHAKLQESISDTYKAAV